MTAKVSNGLDLQSAKIINQADPVSAQDSATKNYVDALVHGLDWGPHVRAASNANVSVTSAPAAIDGVTGVAGDRFLLIAQTAPAENGPWVYVASTSAMTRPTDYTGTIAAKSARTYSVTEGTYAGRDYALQTDTAITVGTTSTTWKVSGLAFWLDVRDYGAKGDGTTDDTTAIQAALTAAAPSSTTSATSPSNTVYVPPGIFVCGPITIPHRVALKGAGLGVTRLLCKASTANNSYMITNLTTATMISVSDMTLLGNLGNQSNTVHGINFNGSGSGSEYTDMRAQMKNLMVQDFTGDGATITGRGACQANAIQVWNCKGHGFNLGIDSEISDCDAGQNGKNGFHITGNTKIANCKAWFSGYWNNGSGSVPQTANFTSGAVFGNGFHWYGSSSGCVSTGIEAQDNARAGLYVSADATPTSSDRVTVSGWSADTNNNNASATTFANVEINNSFDTALTGGLSFDRSANTQHPSKALLVGGGASNTKVEMMTQGFTAANKVSVTAAASYQNVIEVDASSGSYGVAYAATVTPDLSSGAFLSIGTLTGNITVAAPAGSSFNTGTPLTILFTQDATGGRQVTWNAIYYGVWQPNPAPNTPSYITFTWSANDQVWVPMATGNAADFYSARGAKPWTAMLASNTTTTATSVASITGLKIDSVPAGIYFFEMFIPWKVNTTTAPKFGLTGPTLSSMNMTGQYFTSALGTVAARLTAYGTQTVGGTIVASTEYWYEVQGSLQLSGAGTVQAQYFNGAAGTLTAEAGAFMRITFVAP